MKCLGYDGYGKLRIFVEGIHQIFPDVQWTTPEKLSEHHFSGNKNGESFFLNGVTK